VRAEDYVGPAAGRIVRGMSGYDAFLPAPLPPQLEWTSPLAVALSRADAILGELSGLGRLLPAPELLIRPFLQREAVLSSRIEGTRASLDDVLRDEPDPDSADARDVDLLEIRNYVRAMDLGLEETSRRPIIGLNLVLGLHRQLMGGIPGDRGDNASPGRFRTTQNWIGGRRSTPGTAQYVPPPPERLMECLSAWERFTNEPTDLPELVVCALMHEQFEAIHPFNDGNGRVGRLLVTLFLVSRGRLSQPLLYLSEFVEANRQDYYDCLQRVRTHGDWTRWLMFFLDGVVETGRRALDQTTRLIAFREEARARLLMSPRPAALIDPLLSNPYMTVARATRILERSDPTSRLAIQELESHGFLTEVPTPGRRRRYVSRPIMEIIDAPDAGRADR
jgi:Fic family protein